MKCAKSFKKKKVDIPVTKNQRLCFASNIAMSNFDKYWANRGTYIFMSVYVYVQHYILIVHIILQLGYCDYRAKQYKK